MNEQNTGFDFSNVASFIFVVMIVLILLASTFDFTSCTKVEMPAKKTNLTM